MSKNLGLIRGIVVSTEAPTNTKVIWFDDNITQKCHKVYNINTLSWEIIDKNLISSITYSELVTLASQNGGLSLDSRYLITDLDNVLAFTITTTKVIYIDLSGNIIVDDLSGDKEYHVGSSSLLLDGIQGEFDTSLKKLNFKFNSNQVKDSGDYLLIRGQRNGNSILIKMTILDLLSNDSNNSVIWQNGFYFNFSDSIANILDKTGGIISYDLFVNETTLIEESINNIGSQYQNIISTFTQYLNQSISSSAIFQKTLPVSINLEGVPTDISTGDSFITLFTKIQKYINSFKVATGIRISSNFSSVTSALNISSNDTVDTAFRKIQFYLNKIKDETNGIKLKDYSLPTFFTSFANNQTLTTILSNLGFLIQKNQTYQHVTGSTTSSGITLTFDVKITRIFNKIFRIEGIASTNNTTELGVAMNMNFDIGSSVVTALGLDFDSQFDSFTNLILYKNGDVTPLVPEYTFNTYCKISVGNGSIVSMNIDSVPLPAMLSEYSKCVVLINNDFQSR